MRWGVFIKLSPAVEADSVFVPLIHSANIVPIIDKDKSKPHPGRSVLPQVFHSRDSDKPPNIPFSIFTLFNLDLRLTTVDHPFSFFSKNSDCRGNAFPILKIQQRINKKNNHHNPHHPQINTINILSSFLPACLCFSK